MFDIRIFTLFNISRFSLDSSEEYMFYIDMALFYVNNTKNTVLLCMPYKFLKVLGFSISKLEIVTKTPKTDINGLQHAKNKYVILCIMCIKNLSEGTLI